MSNSKKGFTLIELLVVIAIIGILSGIVLTSLGTARNKAKISSAKASISSMRAEAELGADSNGMYVNNMCDLLTQGSGSLGYLFNAVKQQLSDSADIKCGAISVNGDNLTRANRWVVAANNMLGSGESFCVDSTGFSGIPTRAYASIYGDNTGIYSNASADNTNAACQ